MASNANPRVTAMVDANGNQVDGATVGSQMWSWIDQNWARVQALQAQGATDREYQNVAATDGDPVRPATEKLSEVTYGS